MSGEVGSLAGDREFRMSFPDRLTSHDDTASVLDTRRLVLRIIVVEFLAALVWHTDADELRTFDEMLWTFMDGSFVPHEMLSANAAGENESPVLLSAGVSPNASVDIVINLAADLPGCLAHTRRVAEIIDGDDARRRAGRARFKAYRDLGIQPASHNIRGDS